MDSATPIAEAHSFEIQRSLCDELCGKAWDCFSSKNYPELKKKISYGLFGPPEILNEDGSDATYSAPQQYKIDSVFTCMRTYGSYDRCPGTIYLSPIFVICEDLENDNIRSQKVVFRIRKCHRRLSPDECFREQYDIFAHGFTLPDNNPLETFCVLFIDEDGRLYESWKEYLEMNKLPKCTMVVPKDGVYQADNAGVVMLEECKSPACGPINSAVDMADKMGIAGSLVCTVVGLASITPAITVAPLIMTGAGLTSLTIGGYSAVRGIAGLMDRSKHRQTLQVTDTAARGQWISMAGGMAAVAFGGATQLLNTAVSRGADIGQTGRAAFNAVTGANIVANGTGVISSTYGIYERLHNGESISPLECFQTAASILFFGNAIMSVQSANSVINKMQNRTLAEFENVLTSNKKRLMFNKALLEGQRTQGVQTGRATMIQGLRQMDDVNNFFAILARNNKSFNAQGVRFTVGSNGQVLINSAQLIDASHFGSLSAPDRASFLASAAPRPNSVVSRSQVTGVNRDTTASGSGFLNKQSVASLISTLFVNRDVCEYITDMMSGVPLNVQVLFMQIVRTVYENVQDLYPIIENLYPRSQNPCFVVLQYVMGLMSQEMAILRMTDSDEMAAFTAVVKSYHQSLLGDTLSLRDLVHGFRTWLKEQLKQFNFRRLIYNRDISKSIEKTCQVCNGVYYTRLS